MPPFQNIIYHHFENKTIVPRSSFFFFPRVRYQGGDLACQPTHWSHWHDHFLLICKIGKENIIIGHWILNTWWLLKEPFLIAVLQQWKLFDSRLTVDWHIGLQLSWCISRIGFFTFTSQIKSKFLSLEPEASGLRLFQALSKNSKWLYHLKNHWKMCPNAFMTKLCKSFVRDRTSLTFWSH